MIRSGFPNRISKGWLIFAALVIMASASFRAIHLEQKVYNSDEARRMYRISGFTDVEFMDQVYTGEIHKREFLQSYLVQGASRGLSDILNALMTNPEHPPLYYLAASAGMRLTHNFFRPRLFSVILGLLLLPCVYWLSRELFDSRLSGIVAMMLVAVSPYQLLVSQLVSEYTLYGLWAVLSSAVFFHALRVPGRKNWALYALTIALGLYTHIAFGLTVLAQLAYAMIAGVWRDPKRLSGFAASLAAGLLAFVPWLLVIFFSSKQLEGRISYYWMFDADPGAILSSISLTFSSIFMNLYEPVRLNGLWNLLLLLLIAYAVIYTVVKAVNKRGAFLLFLIIANLCAVAGPNLLRGKGIHYAQARYFLLSVLGIQLCVAFAITGGIRTKVLKGWISRFWIMILILLLAVGSVSCAILTNVFDYDKGSAWSANLYIAKPINDSEKPLVISNATHSAILGLSYLVKPDTDFQLFGYFDEEQWRKKVDLTGATAGYSDVFLVMPRSEFMDFIKKNRKFRVETVPEGKYRGGDGWIYRITKEK